MESVKGFLTPSQYQVIYPSAYYPPPVLSHVSSHYKGKNLLFNFKNFFVKEEVIIEAAKMENWRPVNVSFWQETQQTEGAIILISLIFKPIKLQHPHKTAVVKMGPKKLF